MNDGEKKEIETKKEEEAEEKTVEDAKKLAEDYESYNNVVVEDSIDQYQEEKETKTTVSFLKSTKGKLILLMLAIFVILLILLLCLYLVSLFNKRVYTYEEVEKIMSQAAADYFNEHQESLPKQEGGAVEINAVNLIAIGKMKDFKEYLGEGVVCTGSVIIEKTNNRYIAFPKLNCGNNYVSQELYKKIIEKGTTSSGYGLYESNGTYFFRGERVNNHIRIGDSNWRILKITPANKIVLVLNNALGPIPWDTRYNTGIKDNIGINNYNNSRIKDYIDGIKYADIIWNKMVPFSTCIGKRSSSSDKKDNSEECREALKTQMVGLLTVSDYMLASIDSNCKSILSKACQNDNYLNASVDTWLSTADKDTSYLSYCISQEGPIILRKNSETAYVRPVIYLNDKVIYKSGTGTSDDPYMIR